MKAILSARPITLAASLALALSAAASESQDTCGQVASGARPTIGLALGGGGARGGAHVGVLRFLEEMRVPVDYIAGTSMGAIIGGFYATGMSVDEIERVLLTTNWTDLLNDLTGRQDRTMRRKSDDDLGLYGPKVGIGEGASALPGGAVAGQKVSMLLKREISQRTQAQDFDELPIPFRAVAANLVTGEAVIMEEGSLPDALRSSMSVPGLFDPVALNGALLVDGGIVRNLPIDVVREMGADIIIAVNVEFPMLSADQLNGPVAIINQLSTLMVANNTKEQIESLCDRDLLIEPPMESRFGSADFDLLAETIPLGYETAAKANGQLEHLSLDAGAYAAWRQGVNQAISGLPLIDFVRLENTSRFADQVIEKLLTVRTGEPLDQAALEHDIRKIHGLGFIRQAHYELIEENGRTGIAIHVEPDQRGTGILETGLEITGGSRGTSLDIKMAYLKTSFDRFGSEFRGAVQLGEDFGLLAEFYRPLDERLRWVFKPSLMASRRDFNYFDSKGFALEEWELDELTARVSFGREFGRNASLFGSITRYKGDATIVTGTPLQNDLRFEGGEWSLKAIYDRLDNRYLPSEGSFASLEYIDSDTRLGADAEFKQVRFSVFSALSHKRHTAWFGSIFNSTLDGNAPLYAQFTGGGFLNMSGFQSNELMGQHFGFTMMGYRYELGRAGILPAYAGLTFEYGNAADRRDDVYGAALLNGSAYLGYDSPVGPLYFGLGWSEDHSGLLFLRLGTLLGARSIGHR